MTYNYDQDIYDQIADWLEDYQNADNDEERHKLKTLIATRMLPIIKKIARTIARRSYDPIDDLIQAGSIGLLRAIEIYSSDINDNFRIFAATYIIGEMKHFLRDKLDTIKVPRYIQELIYRINSFVNTLTPDELNDLTSEDVAAALNVQAEDIEFAIQSDRRKHTISLEEIITSSNHRLKYEDVISEGDYKDVLDLEDTKVLLKNAINNLPDEYKHLVELYYYKDMSQKDIASELKISKMNVSRQLRKAFSILYEMIYDHEMNINNIILNEEKERVYESK